MAKVVVLITVLTNILFYWSMMTCRFATHIPTCWWYSVPEVEKSCPHVETFQSHKLIPRRENHYGYSRPSDSK